MTEGTRTREPGTGRVPPGQTVSTGWRVMHYGRVPTFRPDVWDFQVTGATRDGQPASWSYDEIMALPHTTVTADFHCVTKHTVLDVRWTGIAVAELLAAAPPAPGVSHVLAWADRGYTANLRLADLDGALLAHSRDGAPLTPDTGWPLRLVVPHLYGWKGPKWVRGLELRTDDQRGFWELRGYHNVGDPWAEQRYSYQEQPGDGPPLPSGAGTT